ncbi:aminotransferase class I/II-fold pyridoxal phosphate-dependent enzyme [Caulobacter sp. BK020]|uniref:aminotransferase class I/II-fold pyridoxal phosphate-dependent enzyme n=1 Tax=Caulobacter sp. BK020 TaxID=2512117 RepID=UPI001049B1EE|nr:aminotransferase class I/II-fold pyridoxal phosphate-dependent enzyme [Caulobacter sp. BK020]TCS17462.1 L-threonine O-3-phosphate decarboxylase [Caulobacter sp. BK020]
MATPAAILGHGGRLGAARSAWPDAPKPWLDLSTGINPWPYPVPLLAPEAWSRLPDPESLRRLERVAATAFGVEDPARVVAAAGSEALIRLLPRLLTARCAAIPARTYGGHADAWRAADARIVDLNDPAADLRVLVNPDNPTGRVLSTDQVLDLTDKPLLVDEAFVDVDPARSVAALAGAPGRQGLMVLRSFGKFHGLAGARLGFLVARPDLATRVRRALGDWPVSGPAIAAGLAAYADTDWAVQTLLRLADDAARLDDLLRGVGFTILGGTSLFRLARAADAPRRFEVLARAGILTRPFPWDETLIRFGLPGPQADWLRLANALESLR